MDFTLYKYKQFLNVLRNKDFNFSVVSAYPSVFNNERNLILRHDVDDLAKMSFTFARIQHELGIKGTYNFRITPGSWDERIIEQISHLGHEVGYHYEDVSIVAGKYRAQRIKQSKKHETGKDSEGDALEKEIVDIAIDSFSKNLNRLRKIVPVKTICMHGSPMSKWDSRLLWKYYDYHDFGIEIEPYFDIDFDEIFYLTDTGRRWDGDTVSVRDKPIGGLPKTKGSRFKNEGEYSEWKVKPVKYRNIPSATLCTQQKEIIPKYHSTSDIISSIRTETFPNKAMITMHPQRWTDNPVPWAREFVWQNMKNVIKYIVVRWKEKG